MTPEHILAFGVSTGWAPSLQHIEKFLSSLQGGSIVGNPFILFAYPEPRVSALYGRILLEALALGYIDSGQLATAISAAHRVKDLLGWLLAPEQPRYAFFNALCFLNCAYTLGRLPQAMYFELLFCGSNPEYTVLHRFPFCIDSQDISNLELYLRTLTDLSWTAGWNQRMCFELLKQRNTCGFPVVHQMANTKQLGVGLAFWRWFKENSMCFSAEERYQLLHLKMMDKLKSIPKRWGIGHKVMGDLLSEIRRGILVEQRATMSQIERPWVEVPARWSARNRSRFFPAEETCKTPVTPLFSPSYGKCSNI